MSKKKTKEEFIKESISIHGNKYDYSKVDYVNNREKVCIICPEHGEFWQSPMKHLSGQGCPLCSATKKNTTDDFISDAKAVHGNKYDYSKVKYVNNKTKVCIICPEHGEFWQEPHNHLKGRGCPICAKTKTKPHKYTTESFINLASEIHEKKYDYSETEYVDMNTKVKIICPEHGEFWQLPYLHINGAACPKCSNISVGAKKRSNKDAFISRAMQPYSKNEIEIFDFVKSIVGEKNVVSHDRSILNGKEIDILIPSLNIAIEYNGLYWHDKDKNYHISKTEECEKKGIRLVQIFEDEYLSHKDIVLNKIQHILGRSTCQEKVMGRKCKIEKIQIEEAKLFLKANHIQGFAPASVHLGAKYNGRLVAVMCFKKEGNEWELVRFASDSNTVCQGVGGKMFYAFIREYNPISIKSFADRRWSIDGNNLYTKLGFKFDGYTPVDYRYYNPYDGAVRHHKFGFRKQILHKKYGLPLTMTESEMTAKLGYSKIYDCGLIRYKWEKAGV